MKDKLNNILNIIGMIVIVFIVISFNLLIGGNEKTLPILPMTIFTGLITLILLIKEVFYKQRIVIKSKIDIAVLSFMICIILPLVFKTYCTYQGTIEFIIKYFFVYEVYLLIRNVVDTKKKKNILIGTTIFSSLIIIILGIDIQHNYYSQGLLSYLNLLYTPNDRFVSTFGYANAVAIYMTFCIYLAINRIENSKNIISKIIYLAYIVLATYIVYITYSRTVLLLLILSLIVYFSIKVYKKVKNNKKLLLTIISVIVIVILIMITYILVAIRISEPTKLENFGEINKIFESEEKYKISFELDNIDTKYPTQIEIIETNKYFTEKELAKVTAKENGVVEVEFTTTKNVLNIRIHSINSDDVIINKCYINDKEYIIKHKYMPYVIAKLVNTLSIRDSSILQRLDFYKDSIKIAKDSIFIGHGGNTWKRMSQTVQEYPYGMKEAHSYFFELLISYGIVGVISFLSIIFLLYLQIIKKVKNNKQWKNENISIAIGLGLFLVHALTFDFDMSFIVTIIAVFEYFALLQYDEDDFKNDVHDKILFNIIDYSIFIVFVILYTILFRANIAKYYLVSKIEKINMCSYNAEYRYDYMTSIDYIDLDKLKTIKDFIKDEPYYTQNYQYKLYWETLCDKMSTLSHEKRKEYLEFGINSYKTVKPASPMYIDTVIFRAETMLNTIKALESNNDKDALIENTIIELKNIIKEEYQVNIKNIRDLERNHINEKQRKQYEEKYKVIMEQI